jgi:hypothetical protein
MVLALPSLWITVAVATSTWRVHPLVSGPRRAQKRQRRNKSDSGRGDHLVLRDPEGNEFCVT